MAKTTRRHVLEPFDLTCPPAATTPPPRVVPTPAVTSCKTCRFWLPDVAAPGRTLGLCRRNPPARVPGVGLTLGQSDSRFPLVTSESWCGEHQPA